MPLLTGWLIRETRSGGDVLVGYETTFCHVVGSLASIAKVAERMEASCMKGAAAFSRNR